MLLLSLALADVRKFMVTELQWLTLLWNVKGPNRGTNDNRSVLSEAGSLFKGS